jgi:hypothetical protein
MPSTFRVTFFTVASELIAIFTGNNRHARIRTDVTTI